MSDAIKGPWMRDWRTVYALNDHGVNRFFASVHDAHTSEQELEEISRLIAAAPELLESLIAIVRSAELNQAAVNTFLLIDARAAIAKATGKEQP